MWEVEGRFVAVGEGEPLAVCREDHKVTEAGVMHILILSRNFECRTRVKSFLGKVKELKAIEDISVLIFFGSFFAIINNVQ